MNNLRHDRRGLSLVELIVGVTILALVASPLMHTILAAGSASRRTEQAGEETLAAQNLLEASLGGGMAELLSNPPWGYGNTVYYTYEKNPSTGVYFYKQNDAENPAAAGGDGYRFALRNISLTAGDTHYDAIIDFDASRIEDNGFGVTQYTPMDAIFAQPFRDTSNPDVLALTELQSYADIIAGAYDLINPPLINRSDITRTISISVNRDSSGRNITALAEYVYQAGFQFSYRYDDYIIDAEGNVTVVERTATKTVTPAENKAIYAYEFYNVRYAESQNLDTALKNVFVFYYPVYGKTDTISIYNNTANGGLPLQYEINLIKQFPAGGVVLSPYDDVNYKANVVLYQNSVSPYVSNPDMPPIFTNIHYSLLEPNKRLESTDGGYAAYVGYIKHSRTFAKNINTSGSGDDTDSGLLKINPVNRMYEVTLRLYPAKTLNDNEAPDPAKLTPLVTLTGSKLE